MNLYKISQTEVTGYNTFCAAVVVAADAASALSITFPAGTWCLAPSAVYTQLLGTAVDGLATGIVQATFFAAPSSSS